jgi:hypothetical protein
MILTEILTKKKKRKKENFRNNKGLRNRLKPKKGKMLNTKKFKKPLTKLQKYILQTSKLS